MNLFLREFADSLEGGSQNRLHLANPNKVMDTLRLRDRFKTLQTLCMDLESNRYTTPLVGVRASIIDCMHDSVDHVEGLVSVVGEVCQAPASVDMVAVSLKHARDFIATTSRAAEECAAAMSNGVFGKSWDSFWVQHPHGFSFSIQIPHGIKRACKALAYGWNSLPVALKLSACALVVWRLLLLLRSEWKQSRICYDGQDDITFCATCSPELLDPSCMVLGNAYEKKFHVPSKCPRCSWSWRWAGWKDATMRIDNSHYQFLGTYSAMRMQRERDVHCPVANQLDVTHEYRFAHRFMQFHAGTIGEMQGTSRQTWSAHTGSYCLATGWREIRDGDATQYVPRAKPGAKPSSDKKPPGSEAATSKEEPTPTESATEQEVETTSAPAAPSATPPVAGSEAGPAATVEIPSEASEAAPAVPPSRKGGGLITITGSLLDATDGYIAHQCNCVMWGTAQGIAEPIFAAHPIANVYLARAKQNRPYDTAGTNTLHGTVINMYGQLLPGLPFDVKKSKDYVKYVKQKQASRDTRSARLCWFVQCLKGLPDQLPPGPQTINFPKYIGCGKGGGEWRQYIAAITSFSEAHPDWTVRVFDLKAVKKAEKVTAPQVQAAEPGKVFIGEPFRNASEAEGWIREPPGLSAPKTPPPTYVPVVPVSVDVTPPPPCSQPGSSSDPAPVPPVPAPPDEPPSDGPACAAVEPAPKTSHINKMRQLWQFIYDNGSRYPQSTMWKCAYDRCRELFNIKDRSLVFDATHHFRLANIMNIGRGNMPTRQLDCEYMTPPPDCVMAPVALNTAQVVGPVTQPITVHNASDKVSTMAALEHRSEVKCSVFADPDGTFPPLEFKKNSSTVRRLDKFWKRFYKVVLTNKAIDNAYQKLFADKDFKEIAMSKFSADEIERIKHELEVTTKAEELENRKANGKNEIVLKEQKAARLVVDNGLKMVALNIITCKIFQHVIFDPEDGIFYDMSIKGRDRATVLDAFGNMMGRPFDTDEPLCAWEIDQTGMELHERCNQKGEGVLGYTYDALMRIDQRVSHKLNGQFSNLHEAKTVFDIQKGMRLRFRVKDPDVPVGMWFTAKFPDMYLDSGWLLTSGVNFMNELSAVLSSFTSNPEHILAINNKTGKFRVRDKDFTWEFKSIPMYQTEESTEVSTFTIRLRGIIEGDDGAGAASRCLADPRNGGKFGLIVAALEELGYSGKLEVMVHGRLELIGAHYPVRDGKVTREVPWCPAVSRYISKLGTHTHSHITPATQAARFLSLASMFAGRIEPLQRGFEAAAERVIEINKRDAKKILNETIKTDGHDVIDRAFGGSEHSKYTLKEIASHYERMAHHVPPRSEVQIRMLNMSVARDPRACAVTRDDFSQLGLFAEECGHFNGDHEAAYAFMPASLR